MRELNINMNFYLQMNENETEQQALDRFYKIMESLQESKEEHESAYQIYESKVDVYED